MDDLIALADSTKTGPWDSYKFSDFDELTPVSIPTENVEECAPPEAFG